MTPALVAPTKSSTPLYVERAGTDHLPLLQPETLPQNIFWQVLSQALTMRRDYGSTTESQFVAWLSQRLGATLIDAAGNLHVDTRFDPSHRTMFTAHTDSVHSSGGDNEVRVDGKFWRAGKGAALGADDGSGCALLAYLIDCGTPGYYVFFRGEERGGVGSKWLSDHMPELFDGVFDRAVAFDRAGYADVITHQSGGRCCSDEFAEALSEKLSADEMMYMPCSGGVYTDTAEFVKLIPECTNISVGYKYQHGDREEQDVEFLWQLARGIVSINWDDLPTVRDPKAKPVYKYSYSGKYESLATAWDDDKYEYDFYTPDAKTATKFDLGEPDGRFATDEYALLYAIDDFRTGVDKTYLMELIAEVAYPEEPGLALRSMRSSRIADEDLDIAEDMLDQGWCAEQVLLELYSVCCTI